MFWKFFCTKIFNVFFSCRHSFFFFIRFSSFGSGWIFKWPQVPKFLVFYFWYNGIGGGDSATLVPLFLFLNPSLREPCVTPSMVWDFPRPLPRFEISLPPGPFIFEKSSPRIYVLVDYLRWWSLMQKAEIYCST